MLNPSVIRNGAIYYNLYSAFDGRTWRTMLAVSGDGSTWSKKGVAISPDPSSWEGGYIAANGSVLYSDGQCWYWYQAGDRDVPQIGLARSNNAINWNKEAAPVLKNGPRGSWDERGVGDPFVLKLDGWFYIYYLGQNRARQQRIGLARSRDGVSWVKLRSSPVLDLPQPGSGAPDENGQGEPSVWEENGSYWMLYTGRDSHERRSLIAARSNDGVHWRKQEGAFRGGSAWNSEVICDPTVLVEPGKTRLWFGGGDVARPDENLNGQIGEGEIRIQ